MDTTPQPGDLWRALAASQAAFPVVPKSGVNAHLRNRYATLDDIRATCLPILGKHGIAVVQSTSLSEDGKSIVVETTLYCGDESETWDMTVPMARASQPIQAYGASRTYACRYHLADILGVSAGEDTDAETSVPQQQQAQRRQAPRPVWTPEERKAFEDAVRELDTDPAVLAQRCADSPHWGCRPEHMDQEARDRLLQILVSHKEGRKLDEERLRKRFFGMWSTVVGSANPELRRKFTQRGFGFGSYKSATREQLGRLDNWLHAQGEDGIAEAVAQMAAEEAAQGDEEAA